MAYVAYKLSHDRCGWVEVMDEDAVRNVQRDLRKLGCPVVAVVRLKSAHSYRDA